MPLQNWRICSILLGASPAAASVMLYCTATECTSMTRVRAVLYTLLCRFTWSNLTYCSYVVHTTILIRYFLYFDFVATPQALEATEDAITTPLSGSALGGVRRPTHQ